MLASQPHAPCIWFCGLSGAGKSTVANELDALFREKNIPACILDGDIVRKGLCKDLGFSQADRHENLRRIREVAKILSMTQTIPIVACITPFEQDRREAREAFKENDFLLVFMDTPLEVCQKRDPKKLYAKAAQGLIKNFTGLDSAFEKPQSADLVIADMDQKDAANAILHHRFIQDWISRRQTH